MGSAYAYDTKAGKRWEARYRKPDGKTARKGGFLRKRDAEAYIAEVEVAKSAGTYIAPSDAHATVAVLGMDWLVAHEAAVKPSTYHSDESAWRIHVEPRWGARRVGSIRHTEVAAWIAELAAAKSPTTVKRCHGVLASILDGAVRDRRIPSNPAREVKTPKKSKKPKPYLSHKQVERLAAASRDPDVIRFTSYTGLRWGEVTGIRVGNVDLTRRRVLIEENAVEVNGHVQVGTPKTHERRAVVYPAFLDKSVRAAVKGKAADDLLWPAEFGGVPPTGQRSFGVVRGCRKEDPR